MTQDFDVHIQLIPPDQYSGMRFYGFGQRRSLGVRGIQKLINMFAKALLTPQGTDPLNPQGGTQLPFLLGSNVTLADAREILYMAVQKAADDIQTYQAMGSAPDEERLASATITQYISIPAAPGFSAQIYIENVAQQGRPFLLPSLVVRT